MLAVEHRRALIDVVERALCDADLYPDEAEALLFWMAAHAKAQAIGLKLDRAVQDAELLNGHVDRVLK